MLNLGTLANTEDFFPLDSGTSDVIIGIQWLEKLGTVSTDWKLQIVQFQWQGTKVILRGDPSLGLSKDSLTSVLKAIRKEGGGLLLELNRVELTNSVKLDAVKAVPHSIQQVLNQFPHVFETPMGLPASRPREHQIILKKGTNPVSVRPYRYPQI